MARGLWLFWLPTYATMWTVATCLLTWLLAAWADS